MSKIMSEASPMPSKPIFPTKKKVAFARHAGIAQRVEEVDSTSLATHIGTPTIQIPPHNGAATKVAVPYQVGKAGRPYSTKAQCNLPPGYRMLRRGLSTYSDELADKLVDAYYANAGSGTRACRDTGVRYASFLQWRATVPHFAEALKEVEEIIQDEAHSQFMERVLTTWEANPTWKLTYFKKHFPQYSETKKSAKFVFNITDTLIKPEYIDGEVIPPKQLESSDESRPSKDMDAPANAGEIP